MDEQDAELLVAVLYHTFLAEGNDDNGTPVVRTSCHIQYNGSWWQHCS